MKAIFGGLFMAVLLGLSIIPGTPPVEVALQWGLTPLSFPFTATAWWILTLSAITAIVLCTTAEYVLAYRLPVYAAAYALMLAILLSGYLGEIRVLPSGYVLGVACYSMLTAIERKKPQATS